MRARLRSARASELRRVEGRAWTACSLERDALWLEGRRAGAGLVSIGWKFPFDVSHKAVQTRSSGLDRIAPARFAQPTKGEHQL